MKFAGRAWACAVTLTLPTLVHAFGGPPAVFVVPVDTCSDVLADDGMCSLREAVQTNNAQAAQGNCACNHPTTGDPVACTGVAYVTLPPACAFSLGIPPDSSPDDNLDGDLDIDRAITIAGDENAPAVLSGEGLDRLFHLRGAGSFFYNFANLVIRDGATNAGGGGFLIEPAITSGTIITLKDLVVEKCSAAMGGALAAARADTATFTLFLYRVGLFDNVATGNGLGYGGGAIHLYGGVSLNAADSTLSGNSTAADGGAIYNLYDLRYGTTELVNLTIYDNLGNSDNDATGQGGGIAMGDAGPAMRLRNTILAHNQNGAGQIANCANAQLATYGYNLLDSSTGCTIDSSNDGATTRILDPMLAPLASHNGSPVRTHAPLSGSPALDSGEAPDCPAPSPLTGARDYDQRGTRGGPGGSGFPRVQNGRCDIGAHEALHMDLSVNASAATTKVVVGVPFEATVSASNSGFSAHATLSHTLSAGLSLAGSPDPSLGTCDGTDAFSCDVSSFQGNLTVSVPLIASAPGPLSLSVEVGAPDAVDASSANDDDTLTFDAAYVTDFELVSVATETSALEYPPETPIKIRAIVKNLGPSPALAGTTVTAIVPLALNVDELTSTSGSCVNATATCVLGALAPSDTVTIDMTVRGVMTTVAAHVALSIASAGDPTMANDAREVAFNIAIAVAPDPGVIMIEEPPSDEEEEPVPRTGCGGCGAAPVSADVFLWVVACARVLRRRGVLALVFFGCSVGPSASNPVRQDAATTEVLRGVDGSDGVTALSAGPGVALSSGTLSARLSTDLVLSGGDITLSGSKSGDWRVSEGVLRVSRDSGVLDPQLLVKSSDASGATSIRFERATASAAHYVEATTAAPENSAMLRIGYENGARSDALTISGDKKVVVATSFDTTIYRKRTGGGMAPATVTCEVNDLRLSGGCFVTGNAVVRGSAPTTNGWTCTGAEGSGSVAAEVTCLDLTP